MKRLSLNFALVGALALGASETAAFAADYAVTEPPPRSIAHTHWHGARRVAVSRCIEVSQPPRGCPLHHYARLPWPGVDSRPAVPCMRSADFLTMASPMPVPS